MITEEQRQRRNEIARSRYANDPEYREKLKAVAKKSEAKLRADPVRSEAYRQRKLASQRVRRSRLKKERTFAPKEYHRIIDGKSQRVFTSTEVALRFNTNGNRICELIRRGNIPETQFQNPRLFTAQQVELIRRWLEVPRYDFERKREIKNLIAECWQESAN